jgi:histidinol dehydrogenase
MSALRLFARGPVAALPVAVREALVRRGAAPAADARSASGGDAAVAADVSRIIARVRTEGDDALRDLARAFDGVSLDALEVPREAWTAALASIEPAVRSAMERSARNLQEVHEAFAPGASEYTTRDGVVIGRRPDAVARVGVYAPGGRASYPSSLLMGAVPARVAGVGEVIVCSPPGADGRPAAALLAAAAIANVDRVFAIGGAGAIAAMAYGTASVPAVDRIVGPGNAYVAEAKLQVARAVGIDSPAGPSELLILADGSASPHVLARELLAQAEHDPEAAVILATESATLADAVIFALETLVDAEPRAAVIRSALRAHAAVLTTATLDEAITLSNEWAPEHLLLAVREDARVGVLARLRNAGTIFMGESSSVAFGDYMSGANHVLPTGGAARRYSGLSTLDFVRWTTWQHIDRDAAAALARDTDTFARAEGLPAHAAAARQWERT